MQNPFRNRPQDDFGRDRDRDRYSWDQRHEAGRHRRDEEPSWRDDTPSYQYRSRFERDDYRAQSDHRPRGYGRNQAFSPDDDWGREQAGWSASSSRPRDYGREDFRADRRDDHGFGQGRYVQRSYVGDAPDHAYAPGSQIWDQSGDRSARPAHEFEPDYLHWRDQQIAGFDRDYHAWRSEKRQKFSSDFDSWRRTRPQNETENPSANAWVGDVSDGGVADVDDKKTRS